MPRNYRRWYQSVDVDELVRLYQPPPEFFERDYFLEPDQIERMQVLRAREEVRRAYGSSAFYRRRWDDAGFDPESFKSLDDLWRIPAYDIDDIRASLALAPPFGDYQGALPSDAADRGPLRIYWSGGTTGRARPTVYTHWDRLVGSLTTARALYLHGAREGQIVLNAWAYSTHNGAWSWDEALNWWLNCTLITASTGNVTPSRRQVEMLLEYEASSIATSPDYLLHLAEVARLSGHDPAKDFAVEWLSTPGLNAQVSEAWGCPVYDGYGTHEVQHVAAECPERGGLHIWEDAFVVHIVDPETGEPLPDGEEGNIVVTCFYKTGSPQVRFNTMDRSTLYPRTRCECGSWLRKMDYFAGRSDTMVKLRGINVWPEAVGELVIEDPRLEPDYFVTVADVDGRDEMIVRVASTAASDERPRVEEDLEGRLKERFGVKIGVDLVEPGSLDDDTGRGVSGKLRRFRDDRAGASTGRNAGI